ncbi:preprotein translocase subunit SecE [Clostridium sp. SYSU_GA19001]|uniref:preprotein translocase subunit SecE n=1 Tax=Clostridium caldaquaticum TaxID=2940653 RepID=UPI002076EF7D|nr:preprotein translocase subunit SecE [Clostridium caldaquaticum]MCM8712079.1 preprotein translocase subunit SecE [Clostridium caldaquaticum]
MAVNGKVKEAKGSNANIFVRFFSGIKAESKRITWAPKKELKKALAAVVTFCVIYVIVVGILDYGFSNLFKLIFK